MKYALISSIVALAFANNAMAQDLQIGSDFTAVIDANAPKFNFSDARFITQTIAIPKGKILNIKVISPDFVPFVEIGKISEGRACYTCAIGVVNRKYFGVIANYLAKNDEQIQIRISTKDPKKLGKFTIQSQLIDYLPPVPKNLNIGANLQGEIGLKSAIDEDGLFYDNYQIALKGNKGAEFTLSSSDFDPAITIIDPKGKIIRDDDGAKGKNARLSIFPKLDGIYSINVSASDGNMGTYSLSAGAAQAPKAIAIGFINEDKPIKGEITARDFSTIAGDEYYNKSYMFYPQKGKSYWIKAIGNFDSKIEIGKLMPQNRIEVLAQNDDSAGSGNPILLYSAADNGAKIIRISPSLQKGAARFGKFTLSIREAKIAPVALRLPMIGENTGQLQDGGARDENRMLADYYRFNLKSGDRLATNANADFDSILEIGTLKDGVFNTIWRDDDSAGNNNPKINFQAEADGEYVLKIKSSAIEKGGKYNLNIMSPPANPIAPRIELTPNAQIQGEINQTSPTYSFKDLPYQEFTFFADNGTNYIIKTNSQEFDATLGVKPDGGDKFIENDDSRDNPPNPQITFSAKSSGKVIVRVSAFKQFQYGKFTLTISSQTLPSGT